MKTKIFAAGLVGMLAFAYAAKAEVAILPPNIEKIEVPTSSPENQKVPFYIRRPAKYDKSDITKSYRVLFICPCINQSGLKVITGSSPLLKLADEKSWFVITPTFKQKKEEAHDRKLSYYYPETWSGKAVLQAMDAVHAKYRISLDKMFLQGLSGGAQFVHRFAIWAPDRVSAVAANSCSWFDEPIGKTAHIAWLVTIGEADPSFDATLSFTEQLRKNGALPLMRSFVGMGHGADERATDLNVAFFKCYDEADRSKLQTVGSTVFFKNEPPLPASSMPLVGDFQTKRYSKNTAEARQAIPPESLVYLPSEVIAELWVKEYSWQADTAVDEDAVE